MNIYEESTLNFWICRDMFIILYKSIVRPLLEYATCIWSPYLKKDIRRLESVQRKATKFVKNI